mmetsp:Transcript_20909/g.26453  ORF Transcript_20909/g.26453 Transcript_20909/m.26453 type:complete len:529 (-) Transcript_20909:244-1830(-)
MPLGKKKADKETNKLFAFVKAGDVHGLKATLKKRHVDLNIRDEEEWTPLCWAVFNGHLEMAQELLRCGAWVNVKDNQGRFPLYFACGWGGEYGENGIFSKILLDAGADIDAVTNDDWSSLYLCAFKGRVSSARELVKRGANVFLVDTQGRTAYHIAAMRKNQPIQELIRAKVEETLRESSKQGQTSVMKKILSGSFDVNINAPQADGRTALHFSMEEGKESSMKLLIEYKADPFVTTKKGETPQDLAANHGNLVLLKLYRKFLMDLGIKVELPKSSDILRSNPKNPKFRNKTQSVLRADSHTNLPGIHSIQKRRRAPLRESLRRTSSTALIHTEQEYQSSSFENSLTDLLDPQEAEIAKKDPYLCGLVKQLTQTTITTETVSFSNLAYGTLLCRLEELVRKLDQTSFEMEDLGALLHTLGMKTKAEIAQQAKLFQPEPFHTVKLVDHYFALACDDDEVDEIIIDPTLAENYLELMGQTTVAEDEKHDSKEIFEQLMSTVKKNSDSSIIEMRKSGSSSSLINALQPKTS